MPGLSAASGSRSGWRRCLGTADERFPPIARPMQPASAEMREAFTEFRDDPELWVAVLAGAGDRAFCAGNDLKYHAEHGAAGQSYPGAETTPFAGITSDFTCWKPIIAAVNGYAMGGGLELVLACDLAVAAENAIFGAPEVKVGLVAAAGGVHRLPRQLPLKFAMGMLLTGSTITAAEALRWGLVNQVVPPAELAAAAELVMFKFSEVPVALIRGYEYPRGKDGIGRLIRDRSYDLFR